MAVRCREFSDGTQLIVGSKLLIKIIIRDIPITILAENYIQHY